MEGWLDTISVPFYFELRFVPGLRSKVVFNVCNSSSIAEQKCSFLEPGHWDHLGLRDQHSLQVLRVVYDCWFKRLKM